MLTAFKPAIYVQISPERLTVKNLKSGAVISEIPEMAISALAKPTILPSVRRPAGRRPHRPRR